MTLIKIEGFSKAVVTILCCLTICTFSYSQKDVLKKANALFENNQFQEALIYYNRIEKIDHSAPLLYKRAVCLWETNKINESRTDFQQAIQYGYKNPKIDYYLGLIYHSKASFDRAAIYYKNYLRNLDIDDNARQQVIKLIRQCGHAIQLSYHHPIAIITNPGFPVNSGYDDFGWINSPTKEGLAYFTTNRPNSIMTMSKGHHEIYEITRSNDQKWTSPKRQSYPINSRHDEVLIGFNQYADALLFYRSDGMSSSIKQHKKGNTINTQAAIPIPVTLGISNALVYFYSDRIVLFAAQLPGGYGGYDIYMSESVNGQWQKPKNLGNKINSEYDELAPSLVHEGHILYFSSNRPQSVGGHDIFRSRFLYESGDWSTPINLGMPVNSPADDLGFVLSDDGLRGNFSSDRHLGLGGHDIYFVQFFEPQEGQNYYGGQLPFSLSPTEQPLVVSNTKKDKELSTPSASLDELPTSYHITPLYLAAGTDFNDEINQDKINQLVTWLHEDRSLHVELSAHSNVLGIQEYNLFSGIKLVEKLKAQLLDHGIEKERIWTKSYGNNYPLITSYKEEDALGLRYNPRIELQLWSENRAILCQSNHQIDDVDRSRLSYKFELFSALISGALVYKLQIAQVSEMYNGFALSLFNDTAIEVDQNTGLYLYTVGIYDNYASALSNRRKLERAGVVNVEVIPYFNGFRLNRQQVSAYIQQFPDLKNYLNYDTIIDSN